MNSSPSTAQATQALLQSLHAHFDDCLARGYHLDAHTQLKFLTTETFVAGQTRRCHTCQILTSQARPTSRLHCQVCAWQVWPTGRGQFNLLAAMLAWAKDPTTAPEILHHIAILTTQTDHPAAPQSSQTLWSLLTNNPATPTPALACIIHRIQEWLQINSPKTAHLTALQRIEHQILLHPNLTPPLKLVLTLNPFQALPPHA